MSNDQFIIHAAIVARLSPREWDEFLAEFHKYVLHLQKLCVETPADQVFIAQGRAREAMRLYETLRDCRPNAEKITTRNESRSVR